MTISRITFGALSLRRLLANASLFAAPDKDCLPSLSVARFEWEDGQLLVVASNRYVLSWEAALPQGADGDMDSFSVKLSDIKPVLGMLPKNDNAQAEISFNPDTDGLIFSCGGQTYRTEAETASFFRWRSLTDNFVPEDHKTIVFSGEYLTALAKVDGGYKNTPLLFEYGTGAKPVRVSIGENFKALLVPVKSAG